MNSFDAGVIAGMEKVALSPPTIGRAMARRGVWGGGNTHVYDAIENMSRGKRRGVLMASFDEMAKLAPKDAYINRPAWAQKMTPDQFRVAGRRYMKRLVKGRGIDRV